MKILLCIALHLYHGPIDSSTQVTEASIECKLVNLERARKVIERCSRESAEKCEVLLPPQRDRIIIEHKLRVD